MSPSSDSISSLAVEIWLESTPPCASRTRSGSAPARSARRATPCASSPTGRAPGVATTTPAASAQRTRVVRRGRPPGTSFAGRADVPAPAANMPTIPAFYTKAPLWANSCGTVVPAIRRFSPTAPRARRARREPVPARPERESVRDPNVSLVGRRPRLGHARRLRWSLQHGRRRRLGLRPLDPLLRRLSHHVDLRLLRPHPFSDRVERGPRSIHARLVALVHRGAQVAVEPTPLRLEVGKLPSDPEEIDLLARARGHCLACHRGAGAEGGEGAPAADGAPDDAQHDGREERGERPPPPPAASRMIPRRRKRGGPRGSGGQRRGPAGSPLSARPQAGQNPAPAGRSPAVRAARHACRPGAPRSPRASPPGRAHGWSRLPGAGATRPARGSPRPRPCRSGGRTRGP